jgi:hypothetical protein
MNQFRVNSLNLAYVYVFLSDAYVHVFSCDAYVSFFLTNEYIFFYEISSSHVSQALKR